MSGSVSAALLIIGDEILSGRTRDANLPFLAERLNEAGIQLVEARIVADVEAAIIAAVNALRAQVDYLFTTGGIGPTHDDITAAAIARAFGRPLRRNEEAVRRLTRHYGGPEQLTEARLKMADMPEGAAMINNPVSGAPGFIIDNVYVMAGVPKIMQGMVDSIIGGLKGARPMLSRALACSLPESVLAPGLAEIQSGRPDVAIGSYPWFRGGSVGVSIVMRSPDMAALDAVAEAVAELMRRLGGEPKAA